MLCNYMASSPLTIIIVLILYSKESIFIDILVYVDDTLVTGSSLAEVTAMKTYLSNKFKIKDLGPLKYFLDIEVVRSTTSFYH